MGTFKPHCIYRLRNPGVLAYIYDVNSGNLNNPIVGKIFIQGQPTQLFGWHEGGYVRSDKTHDPWDIIEDGIISEIWYSVNHEGFVRGARDSRTAALNQRYVEIAYQGLGHIVFVNGRVVYHTVYPESNYEN
jgi:hypothetical protein